MSAPVHPSVVEFWFDPVCPYSWTASRWLHEAGHLRRLTVRHHVMSLYLLNEHRTDVAPAYRRNVEASRGPARVAAAVASMYGNELLERFYTAFGEIVFDHWRRPSAAEYHEVIRTTLARVDLPDGLEDVMDSDEHDGQMRRSHEKGVSLVGGEAGTPITSIDGAAFFGPVLNAIPRGEEAVQVFDGARLLAGYPQFFELKRTRTHPPIFT
ncbi:DSBA-like thioredoxin domain-containing protein [Humibacillus xanthopallidus]|uniref:DSBA-like thioredoxin domain-containing protein n=1 Tax=Humibacillus xanthopallidus TaxID=412689 RepID=A0A543PWP7_9MICO|nr:DsbA family protein [Humibacillus xanthopallidus]TQN48502.1 DSBA-like thioredoxin domain-containing protein [Humibacillus xanthopallidus]